MTLTAQALVQAAQAAVPGVTVDEARTLLETPGWLFVDVRETEELASGAIPGAVHAPRGNLEFLIDPSNASFLTALAGAKTLVFVCGSGGRASLAGLLAQDFGYDARFLVGGMRAWREAGL